MEKQQSPKPNYASPEVTVVTFAVEQGFVGSGPTPSPFLKMEGYTPGSENDNDMRYFGDAAWQED